MNKLIMAALAFCFAAVAYGADRPLLVGHRGSDTGVENSVESFTTGAKRGYDYLETDWKLTADNQFVCSHDDDTKRLGGTLALANSTLEQLQSETLTQKRGGVTYTGRLCSAKEYLDICRENNVKPLIELKWTRGINSNDCSNIPMLIKFIEDNGFRNNCIILTSMKPCLEYIRKNYPDIKLQFLTGQYWANHFDWCVEYGMDVDIQANYFDKSTVDKFHEAGLKVNMWTTNTAAGYKTYAEMGCDMITTDSLDPDNLPDIVILPPPIADNEPVEDIDLVFERRWIMSESTGNHPGNIDGTNAQQGTAAGGYVYVNDCAQRKIFVFNSAGLIGTLEGGAGFGCTRDDAGNIIVRDDKLTGTTHSFIVYSAGALPGTANSVPAARFTAEITLAGQTNFISADGDVLAAEGGHIYMYPNKQTRVNIINVADGAVTSVTESYELTMIGSTATYVIPYRGNPDWWLYQLRTTGISDYNNGNNTAIFSGRPSTTPPNRNSTGGGACFKIKGNRILAYNTGTNYVGGFTVKNLSTDNLIATVDPIGTKGYASGGNYSTFNWLVAEKENEAEYTLYQYCPANGMACYRLYDRNSGVDTVRADTDGEVSVWADAAGILHASGTEATQWNVYDASGTQVAAGNDISHLPRGFYMVSLNGGTHTFKIVK